MLINSFFIIFGFLFISILFSYFLDIRDSAFISKKFQINIFLIGGLHFALFFIFYFEKISLDKIFIILSFLFLGYADDKYNLKVLTRFILSSLFLTIFFLYGSYNLLYLSFLPDFFLLQLITSLIVILGFMHTTNMSDGKNGLLSSYYLITFLFIFLLIKNSSPSIFELLFIYSLIIFIIFNIFNIDYLGNSGVLILSIISYIIFNEYYKLNLITVVDIFSLFSFLIFDGFRVTFNRIKNKNPIFKGDLKHLHNLFKSWKIGYFIYFSLFILNLTCLYFFRSFSYLLCIISSLFLYFILYKISSISFISSKKV